MHLLQAQPGRIDDWEEAVDLGQTPADLVFISAADTELASLAEARADLGADACTLRLANLVHLRHPMSVDMHISACAEGSRLVVARILGGAGYWPYGAEQYAARLGAAGVPFAALPGDDKPDPELRRISTVSRDAWEHLLAYLVEGGPENARNFLRYARAILDRKSELPPAAKPLLRAGLYWPGKGVADLAGLSEDWIDGAPVAPVVFYRALLQGAGLNPVNRLVRALLRAGVNPMPVFVASLKDPVSAATLQRLFEEARPSVILNCTAFAAGSPDAAVAKTAPPNPLASPAACRAPVLQVVFSGSSEQGWQDSMAGLAARDIAMNVALPEVDGRILTRAVSFKDEAYFDEATECPVAAYRARGDRIEFVARLAANWVRLQAAGAKERKIGLVLANYPNRDGRLANGVGLDTPAAAARIVSLLSENGYRIGDVPTTGGELMRTLLQGPTNASGPDGESGGARLPLDDYRRVYAALPWDVRDGIESRWGPPEADPRISGGSFVLPLSVHDNLAVGIQPARGYNINPKDTYHSPDLYPPHNYLAFYFWLREAFGCHAIIHLGKHGNLEWLPGKALALSASCLPEAVLGPVPHVYPFIVNDPGEGAQAKRRASAVIIDHLTPPLARAETYGPLKDLEALVDEYYDAAGLDARRLEHLRREILSLSTATGIDADAGFEENDSDGDLARLDAYLCELKEAQIRDGLHVFGESPDGELETGLLQALVRVPRGAGRGGDASLQRAIAADLALGFDPLDCDMSEHWTGPRPGMLDLAESGHWRSSGDTVERVEAFAGRLLRGEAAPPGSASREVLAKVEDSIRPALRACGPGELNGLLAALSGKFVPPAPSGAPTRGRLDVLPTGRNFFSVDSRAIPTPSAWALGWKSANLLIEHHLQAEGEWPRAMLLTAWGTANMRTGGDDIAQALALMGVRPAWDSASRRVTGFEILPLAVLDRPRVDVTLRISGFFRDAFPQQVDLIDSAARAVMALDEPADMNPAAARSGKEDSATGGFRVFGSKPGSYGAGLQALIDERIWRDRGDLADAYLEWGGYAYGGGAEGAPARAALERRVGLVEAVVHNQDNREHDLLDSDDYYQFEGGAAAAVATVQGRERPVYHNDHSRPERPVIRTLEEEIGRVVRSRVVNPKWIRGVMRHGYKGAFELAATVDYLFAFAATTGAVRNHHFDLVYGAYLEDRETREFIAGANAPALSEIASRLAEAIERGMWTPRSNSARATLEGLLARGATE